MVLQRRLVRVQVQVGGRVGGLRRRQRCPGCRLDGLHRTVRALIERAAQLTDQLAVDATRTQRRRRGRHLAICSTQRPAFVRLRSSRPALRRWRAGPYPDDRHVHGLAWTQDRFLDADNVWPVQYVPGSWQDLARAADEGYISDQDYALLFERTA